LKYKFYFIEQYHIISFKQVQSMFKLVKNVITLYKIFYWECAQTLSEILWRKNSRYYFPKDNISGLVLSILMH